MCEKRLKLKPLTLAVWPCVDQVRAVPSLATECRHLTGFQPSFITLPAHSPSWGVHLQSVLPRNDLQQIKKGFFWENSFPPVKLTETSLHAVSVFFVPHEITLRVCPLTS